jgi:hypothetical protein
MPLDFGALEADTRARLGGDPENIFRVVARHPKLLKRWLVFGLHVLLKNSLLPASGSC